MPKEVKPGVNKLCKESSVDPVKESSVDPANPSYIDVIQSTVDVTQSTVDVTQSTVDVTQSSTRDAAQTIGNAVTCAYPVEG